MSSINTEFTELFPLPDLTPSKESSSFAYSSTPEFKKINSHGCPLQESTTVLKVARQNIGLEKKFVKETNQTITKKVINDAKTAKVIEDVDLEENKEYVELKEIPSIGSEKIILKTEEKLDNNNTAIYFNIKSHGSKKISIQTFQAIINKPQSNAVGRVSYNEIKDRRIISDYDANYAFSTFGNDVLFAGNISPLFEKTGLTEDGLRKALANQSIQDTQVTSQK
jgi:hypothetical protein